jgi:hypothetical protein
LRSDTILEFLTLEKKTAITNWNDLYSSSKFKFTA